jgi:hypothetical protein
MARYSDHFQTNRLGSHSMPNVYVVNESGTTEAMERVRCKDEKRELQDILEHNNDLLPGDQIDPDDPCRWMLIKREMPVPDPSTGTNRWSIDFVFVDQSGMPTFVECKRFDDTRSRREVVGQVLEYAANGQYFWSKEVLRDYAEASAKQSSSTIEEALRALQPNEDDSIESFFERVAENLKAGQIRIVFFLEEAPNELKSLVDFLNKQMVSSEILLVEARQYTRNGVRVVVPTLFGFTEQARQLKRTVTVKAREPREWDWPKFEADAQQKGVESSVIQAMKKLRDACAALSAEIDWGRGKDTGSFNPKWPSICSASILSVYSNGTLSLNFLSIRKSDIAESFRDKLKEMVVARLGLQVPDDYQKKWVSFPSSAWVPKVDALIEVLQELLAYSRRDTSGTPRI